MAFAAADTPAERLELPITLTTDVGEDGREFCLSRSSHVLHITDSLSGGWDSPVPSIVKAFIGHFRIYLHFTTLEGLPWFEEACVEWATPVFEGIVNEGTYALSAGVLAVSSPPSRLCSCL